MQSLDKIARELGALTESFVARLPEATAEDVEAFIADRQQWVEAWVQHPATTEERRPYRLSMERILQYDRIIQARCEELRQEAQSGMNKVAASRIQRNGYEMSYAMDSAFVDKRK
ncbi:hypothetical protein [Paenibacillus ginsengihumi]|uniref:hypothetical protein n=1 Tax=Paenibacillus ginsengihumi TaxID=431596 RepID=UPI00037DC731|nr:hypothetical protein [Paenibacillus ginsengihumi]